VLFYGSAFVGALAVALAAAFPPREAEAEAEAEAEGEGEPGGERGEPGQGSSGGSIDRDD
jgi:hypothetical protein